MNWTGHNGYGVRIVAASPELRDKIRRERALFKRKLWRMKNKEKISAQRRAWAERHREYEKARKQRWEAANRDRINARRRRRYALMGGR